MIDSEQICFIVQGPIYKDIDVSTKKTIESIRKFYPKSFVVLSTWENEIISDLDYDKLVLSKDIEGIKMLDIWNERPISVNTNRQIVSTMNAIKKTNKPYIAKIRSDSLITNSNLKELLKQDYESFKNTFFENRILSLPALNPKKPLIGGKKVKIHSSLTLPDWYFIGQYNDIYNFFDLELQHEKDLKGDKINGLHCMQNNLSSEQYLFFKFFQKNNQDIKIEVSENKLYGDVHKINELLVSNFSFHSSKELGISNQKYPKSSYGSEPILSSGLFTRNEWIRMYNNHAIKKLKTNHYLLEQIIYKIQYNLRFIIFHLNKDLYIRYRDLKNRKIKNDNNKKS
jgi:hypothetical protein